MSPRKTGALEVECPRCGAPVGRACNIFHRPATALIGGYHPNRLREWELSEKPYAVRPAQKEGEK